MPNSEARSESNFSTDDAAILTPSSESSEALYNGPASVEKLADIVKEICKRLPWHLGGNFHKLSEQISQMGDSMAAEAREARRLRCEVDRLTKEVVGVKMESKAHFLERMARMEVASAAEEESSRLRQESDRLASEVAALRSEGAEWQQQISSLQKQVEVLREERIADRMRQLDHEKESLQLVKRAKRDCEMQLGGALQEDRNTDLESRSSYGEEPGSIRSEETLAGIQSEPADQKEMMSRLLGMVEELRPQQQPSGNSQQEEKLPESIKSQLNDQKEMMSRLLEINEQLRPQLLFDPHKIGFFDPDVDQGRDTHGDYGVSGTTMFYRNVELFIEAADAATRNVPVSVVRKNLQYCLFGRARTWYIVVLTAEERNKAATGHRLSNWTRLLRETWGDRIQLRWTDENISLSEKEGLETEKGRSETQPPIQSNCSTM